MSPPPPHGLYDTNRCCVTPYRSYYVATAKQQKLRTMDSVCGDSGSLQVRELLALLVHISQFVLLPLPRLTGSSGEHSALCNLSIILSYCPRALDNRTKHFKRLDTGPLCVEEMGHSTPTPWAHVLCEISACIFEEPISVAVLSGILSASLANQQCCR